MDAKVYSTYYTTRKDNEWAKANPDEIQQMYIMTSFHTAVDTQRIIHSFDGLFISRYVKSKFLTDDTSEMVGSNPPYNRRKSCSCYRMGLRAVKTTGDVTIHNAKAFHDYTVSFLAYIMWDPVHMYNAVVNDWQGVEKQITFDVRQPKTREFTMRRLRKYIEDNPHIDVIRYTTFFHQFTLMFDELAREKYVDWYGYSASVSPYILEQFEQEVGYKFRPEFIIDQGYYEQPVPHSF